MTSTVPDYDIIIVGAGPAGLSAGVYAARARRRTLLIDRGVVGGQISLTSDVENYPGFDCINGFELGQAMHAQGTKYGMETASADVSDIERQPDGRHLVRTSEGDFVATAVILAGGADHNRLGVPGEERLIGAGVSYCATCDGAFFKDQVVAVIGGGDAAIDEGLFLTRYVREAHVIHRRDTLRATAILQERAFAEPKMDFRWNSVVEEILGAEEVTGIRIRDLVTGKVATLGVKGVFIFVGLTPNTSYLRGRVRIDAGGHVYANEWMETDVPGLYAAGDIRTNSARQVVSAAGDGATAAIRADHYIASRATNVTQPGS